MHCRDRYQCGAVKGHHRSSILPADWLMAAVTALPDINPRSRRSTDGTTIALAKGLFHFRSCNARQGGACILAADSEHNARFRRSAPAIAKELVRVIITASGGPFPDLERAPISTGHIGRRR